MNSKLKAVLTAGTLLGAAYGSTSLALAGPMTGMGQAAPAIDASEAVDAPRIEQARYWHRGGYGWHRGWHRHWHRHW